MSFKFDYSIIHDEGDVIHEEGEDCEFEISIGGVCECTFVTKIIRMNLETSCGPNLEYKFVSNVSFCINNNDKNNLKKFIKIMKLECGIDNLVIDAKETIKQLRDDITYLSKNQRLYFDEKKNIVVFNFDTSRDNDSSINLSLEKEEICFKMNTNQCCTSFCSCGNCEYYRRFTTDQEIRVPFKLEIKNKMINAFKDILEILKDEK
jgi:hypothetical protein